ncbi:uncharacterized protein [Macaca nemestrina]|uniref:uncharacterized protein isoform X1 n=1 Tax=Macaca nemestrina TaxID=9545 RepID=UPI0039B9967C
MGPLPLAGGHHSTCQGRMDMVEDVDSLWAQEREDIIMNYEKVQVGLLLGGRPVPVHPGQRVLGSLGAQGGDGWPLPPGPYTLYLGPLTKASSGLQGHRAGLPEDMGPEPVEIYNNIDHFGILHETELPPATAREAKQMRREITRKSKWMEMLGQWETYKNSKKVMCGGRGPRNHSLQRQGTGTLGCDLAPSASQRVGGTLSSPRGLQAWSVVSLPICASVTLLGGNLNLGLGPPGAQG